MKKSLILALVAALPTFAQQDATPALPTPPAPGVEQPRHWGAAGEMPARPSREDFQKKMLEKFDTNKDGQISEEEKAAMKAAMPQRPGKQDKRGDRGNRGPKGPRGEQRPNITLLPEGIDGKQRPAMPQEMIEKLDTDKDGKVSKEEFQAARPKHGERKGHKRGDRGNRGPKGPRGQKPAGAPSEAPAGDHTPVTLPL